MRSFISRMLVVLVMVVVVSVTTAAEAARYTEQFRGMNSITIAGLATVPEGLGITKEECKAYIRDLVYDELRRKLPSGILLNKDETLAGLSDGFLFVEVMLVHGPGNFLGDVTLDVSRIVTLSPQEPGGEPFVAYVYYDTFPLIGKASQSTKELLNEPIRMLVARFVSALLEARPDLR
ncbi:MAG TPA: hypothetical protein GXX51_11405 [Firmicutes bacterium]|nr:hypothetical protein [Bacillota bacterium]